MITVITMLCIMFKYTHIHVHIGYIIYCIYEEFRCKSL